jgi:hypothetical protein
MVWRSKLTDMAAALSRCCNAASSVDAHVGQSSARMLALTRLTNVTVPGNGDPFAEPARSHAACAIAARNSADAITG